MTPDQWLERADHCDRQAEQLAAEGRIAEAVVESVRAQRYREVAEEMRRALPSGNRPVMVKDVTASQLARRGASVARAAAVKSGHAVPLAIAASQWKTLTKYASQRLRKSQAALSRYISGSLETPPEVADQVRKDFGLGDDVWPRPPRR